MPVKRFASGVFFIESNDGGPFLLLPFLFFWGLGCFPDSKFNVDILIKKLASSKQTKTTKKIGNSTGGSEDAAKFKE